LRYRKSKDRISGRQRTGREDLPLHLPSLRKGEKPRRKGPLKDNERRSQKIGGENERINKFKRKVRTQRTLENSVKSSKNVHALGAGGGGQAPLHYNCG